MIDALHQPTTDEQRATLQEFAELLGHPIRPEWVWWESDLRTMAYVARVKGRVALAERLEKLFTPATA